MDMTTLTEEQTKYLDMMKTPVLADFAMQVLSEHGTEEKLEEANKVIEVFVAKARKQKLLSDNSYPTFIDVVIASAFVHNLFYDPADWTTLFKARQTLSDMAKEIIGNQQIVDAVFQTVECQLGEDTPVPSCKPVPNSPTDSFADAIWIAKELLA